MHCLSPLISSMVTILHYIFGESSGHPVAKNPLGDLFNISSLHAILLKRPHYCCSYFFKVWSNCKLLSNMPTLLIHSILYIGIYTELNMFYFYLCPLVYLWGLQGWTIKGPGVVAWSPYFRLMTNAGVCAWEVNCLNRLIWDTSVNYIVDTNKYIIYPT